MLFRLGVLLRLEEDRQVSYQKHSLSIDIFTVTALKRNKFNKLIEILPPAVNGSFCLMILNYCSAQYVSKPLSTSHI